MNNFTAYFKKKQEHINAVLANYLPTNETPANLHQAMRYAVLNGGKRLRPILVYLVGESYGATLNDLNAPAAAIEMIHSFSLVHDDLPAMDNDDLRRGKPTCHKFFDEATAILAGDSLMILALQILTEQIISPQKSLEMIKIITSASGAKGMAGGQDIDIQATNKKLTLEQLEEMYLLKTGALLSASIKLGAVAADAPEEDVKNLEVFARILGLAFQIRDDLLDIESTADKIGKNTGRDLENHKLTYPQIAGTDAAKEKLHSLYQEANIALDKLSINPIMFKQLLALL